MPAARCPNDAEPTVFSQELIDAVLDEHNKLRNQQALGQTPGFGPATRMATMVSIFFFFFFSNIQFLPQKNRKKNESFEHFQILDMGRQASQFCCIEHLTM